MTARVGGGFNKVRGFAVAGTYICGVGRNRVLVILCLYGLISREVVIGS